MERLRCYQCGNPKFGLIRHWYKGKVFCKMSCRNNYVQGRARVPIKQYELPLPDSPKKQS